MAGWGQNQNPFLAHACPVSPLRTLAPSGSPRPDRTRQRSTAAPPLLATFAFGPRHKLAYWIFVPVALALLGGSILLIWYHPANLPLRAIYGALICLVLARVLTALFWGR